MKGTAFKPTHQATLLLASGNERPVFIRKVTNHGHKGKPYHYWRSRSGVRWRGVDGSLVGSGFEDSETILLLDTIIPLEEDHD